MDSYTQRFSEGHHIDAGELHADSYAVGTYGSTWLSMRDYHRLVALIDIGDMVAGATCRVHLQEATAVDGTGIKDIAGKTTTILAQADGDGNQRIAIELRSEELDVANNFDFVRAHFTVSNAAVEACVILMRFIPRYAAVGTAQLAELIP